MQYIVSNSFRKELTARKKFIEKSTCLWFYNTGSKEHWIGLKSMPENCLDLHFIIGHNSEVLSYIKQNIENILETTIVAVTCEAKLDLDILKKYNKTLYLPTQNKEGFAELLDGSKYNLGFELTSSELLFFRSKERDILKRVQSFFIKK